MSEYIKILCAVIIICILIAFVKDVKKEYGIIISLLSATIILLYALKNTSVIINQIFGLMNENNIDASGIIVLIKAVGISAVCQFACEMCAETNNRMLQFSVELIGKNAILIISLPLVSTILKIVAGYIK